MSRLEELLTDLINNESVSDFVPQSRIEEFLKACIEKSGIENTPNPESRVDELMFTLADNMKHELSLYVTNCVLDNLPETFKVNFPIIKTLGGLLAMKTSNNNIKHLEITWGSQPDSAAYIAGKANSLEYIKLSGDTSHITNWEQSFRDCWALKTIDGDPINFSSTTKKPRIFQSCRNLQNVKIVPNTIFSSISQYMIDDCSLLSNVSLISIANGLNETVSDMSVKFHATPKAKLSTIMGTVTTVDGVNTFTADESGDVSLEDFITDYKGWTLA